MRRAVMGVALVAWAGPALALVEPDSSGRAAEVRPDARDSRVRTVEYARGAVIRLVASRGKTLMVELPEGQEIETFLASDQDVMDGTIVEEERGGANRGAGGNAQQGSSNPREGPSPCSMTANLQVCVRRDRFISFKPITELDPQPVHVLALRLLPNGKVGEVPYLFQLETEGRGESPSGRMAGEGVPPPAHYYAVRVVMPASPPPARPAGVARPAGRAPSLARTQPQNLPAVSAPPAPVNSAYELQGDRGLVGAAR